MNRESIKIGSLLLMSIILLAAMIYAVQIQPIAYGNWNVENFDLHTFSSYDDLTTYLRESFTSSTSSWKTGAFGNGSPRSEVMMVDDMQVPAAMESYGGDEGSVDYSETNVQVEGVDEPDIVKTDGTNLYVVADNTVYIILAYLPENAVILSTIELEDDESIQNLFVDGDRLVIFSTIYDHRIYLEDDIKGETSSLIEPWYASPETQVTVFDIGDSDAPTQVREIVLAGTLVGARLIDGFVYVITSQYSYETILPEEGEEVTPRLLVDDVAVEIPVDNIFYVDIPGKSSTATNIASFAVHDDTSDVNIEMYFLGYTQTLFVSQNNIYVAYAQYSYDYSMFQEIIDEVLLDYLPDSLVEELETVETLTLTDYQKQSVSEWILQNYASDLSLSTQQDIAKEVLQHIERTIIHRIHIENGDIEYMAQGNVPGHFHNQFSFSEHDGHLRVSTTLQGWRLRSYLPDLVSLNHVFVLNMDLEIVGSIEDLAPGENIYATRFMGDRCYLVTFKQVDPFFVIDLADPENPELLGSLKIPGYSTYLHAYDDDHIIGIGMEDNTVKISLFDVTDVTNPVEKAKYTIEPDDSSWGSSTALYEHKAFLFDRAKNLLVLPAGSYKGEEAYVFDITPEDGINLKGTITHDIDYYDDDEETYHYRSGGSILRSLYIENVLYTMSTSMIKMNSLEDLQELNSLSLE